MHHTCSPCRRSWQRCPSSLSELTLSRHNNSRSNGTTRDWELGDRIFLAITIHFNMKAVGSVEWSVFSVEERLVRDILSGGQTNTGNRLCTLSYHLTMLTLSSSDLVVLAQSGQYEVILYFQASASHAYYYYSYVLAPLYCYYCALLHISTDGYSRWQVGCLKKHMLTPVYIPNSD